MSGSRLSLSAYVALRYLRSTRKDAYITFLSVSAAGGICLGVAALILALGALNGFQTELRSETLARTPHIEIEIPPDADGTSIEQIALGVGGVVETQILSRGRVWVVAHGRARAAEMIGFEGDLPAEFPGATNRRSGLYISNRLADTWGISPGQVVEIASSRPTLTPFGPQPRVRRLPVTGIFTAGRAEQAERVAVPLPEARLLTGESDLRIVVRSTSLNEALRVADRLELALPNESVIQTWKDINRPLFFALQLERTLMFFAVFLIVIVAAMALLSDLMLILASKQPEIGMLGAMGAGPAKLRKIFVYLGASLVAIGSICGTILGVGSSWLLDRYRVISLPDQVYFLDHVPFLVRPVDVGLIVGSTLLVTLFCTQIAASRAASLSPVEALRR